MEGEYTIDTASSTAPDRAADPLAQPLRLPCGAILSNRLGKTAMTEAVADSHLNATARHEKLYRQWSQGGAGLLLTGNVMIDKRVLERPGNVAIDNNGGIDQLKRWAKAGTSAGNHFWIQLSHAGRQCPWYVNIHPPAPSAVRLKMLGNFGTPRALTEEEILALAPRFARAAVIAREAGFTGVQIHSAHGYLINAFLSPVTNQRTDAWGGTLENRARLLLEVLRATRRAVGADFPISVKLNSDDFRKGGFTHQECLAVVHMLNQESVDLLEISGGTYEQPRMMGALGNAGTQTEPVRQSTKLREAYFLEYAAAIRKIAAMPVMVTGGFRSRDGMVAALTEGACDVIGLGRPLCTEVDFVARLLSGQVTEAPRHESRLRLGSGRLLSGVSPLTGIRQLNTGGSQAWYYQQIFRLADGKLPRLDLGIMNAFFRYLFNEYATAFRMKRSIKRLSE